MRLPHVCYIAVYPVWLPHVIYVDSHFALLVYVTLRLFPTLLRLRWLRFTLPVYIWLILRLIPHVTILLFYTVYIYRFTLPFAVTLCVTTRVPFPWFAVTFTPRLRLVVTPVYARTADFAFTFYILLLRSHIAFAHLRCYATGYVPVWITYVCSGCGYGCAGLLICHVCIWFRCGYARYVTLRVVTLFYFYKLYPVTLFTVVDLRLITVDLRLRCYVRGYAVAFTRLRGYIRWFTVALLVGFGFGYALRCVTVCYAVTLCCLPPPHCRFAFILRVCILFWLRYVPHGYHAVPVYLHIWLHSYRTDFAVTLYHGCFVPHTHSHVYIACWLVVRLFVYVTHTHIPGYFTVGLLPRTRLLPLLIYVTFPILRFVVVPHTHFVDLHLHTFCCCPVVTLPRCYYICYVPVVAVGWLIWLILVTLRFTLHRWTVDCYGWVGSTFGCVRYARFVGYGCVAPVWIVGYILRWFTLLFVWFIYGSYGCYVWFTHHTARLPHTRSARLYVHCRLRLPHTLGLPFTTARVVTGYHLGLRLQLGYVWLPVYALFGWLFAHTPFTFLRLILRLVVTLHTLPLRLRLRYTLLPHVAV